MKKNLVALIATLLVLSTLAGCGQPNNEQLSANDSSAAQEPTKPDANEDQPQGELQQVHFSDWNGDWNRIVDFLEDPALDDAYAEVAEREEVEPSVIKERFLTRYATDLVAFTIEGDTLTVYSASIGGAPDEAAVVAQNTYSFVGQIEEGSTWNHFQANEEDALYPVLLMIAPGRDSAEAVYHTHYRYGHDVQALLDMQGLYPTMVAADATAEEIYNMIID